MLWRLKKQAGLEFGQLAAKLIEEFLGFFSEFFFGAFGQSGFPAIVFGPQDRGTQAFPFVESRFEFLQSAIELL